jgi:MoaA/NifB/PqqE/SkfB family radical SAM enzyme
VQRLVDEAAGLGFGQVYFTGGEPFLLAEIYDILAYASARLPTTVLTNAMLFTQKVPGTNKTRLDRLSEIGSDNLTVQVSLDGARPEHHDPYRGAGTWEKTVEGIKLLQSRSFKVRLGTTETAANAGHLAELCEFHHSLDISEEDHIIRPLARRGFSTEGIEVTRANVTPEITVNTYGMFWHPLSTEADMSVSNSLLPLGEAVERVQAQLAEAASAPQTQFKCG